MFCRKEKLGALTLEAEAHDKKIKDFWMNHQQTLFLAIILM